MPNKISSLIIDSFGESCARQFEVLGCDVTEVKNASSTNEMMSAYIKAGSDDLSLSLLLRTPRLLLAQTMPVVEEDTINNPECQQDWNMELANRFLGRLKNMLLDHGCRLQNGLPEVLNDNEVKLILGGENITGRFFEVSTDITQSTMECYLEIDIHNLDMPFIARRDAGDNAPEGEVVFL